MNQECSFKQIKTKSDMVSSAFSLGSQRSIKIQHAVGVIVLSVKPPTPARARALRPHDLAGKTNMG